MSFQIKEYFALLSVTDGHSMVYGTCTNKKSCLCLNFQYLKSLVFLLPSERRVLSDSTSAT